MARPKGTGRAPLVATCECGHAGMWHKPDCRIRNCDCQKFKHGVVRASTETSTYAGPTGEPVPRRNRGPNE